MQFEYIGTEPPTGYAPPGSMGLDLATSILYVTGANGRWTQVGGSSLALPVSLVHGGTGVAAANAAQARAGLVAAQSGVNNDITSLNAAGGELFVSAPDGVEFERPVSFSEGMVLDGGAIVDTLLIGSISEGVPVALTADTGEIQFGSETSTTATAGGVQAVPGTVDGYIVFCVGDSGGGTKKKIAYFNV